jgi:hypothetical protein
VSPEGDLADRVDSAVEAAVMHRRRSRRSLLVCSPREDTLVKEHGYYMDP